MLSFDKLLVGLKDEVLWLLLAFRTLQRRSGAFVEKSKTRLDLIEELILIEALTHEVVIRLCRLDDEQAGAKLFRAVPKSIRSHVTDQKQLDEIDRALGEYRKSINHLKVKHRNMYIAHLQEGEESKFRFPTLPDGLMECLQIGVRVVDIIAGSKVGYQFHPGSQESRIDLRLPVESP